MLVVGVNGTGKTTTIGKLAARERANGRRVVLAAADTFRAAAIDQLRIWAQRTGAEIVAHAPNADPAAVVFDALDAAVARHADILIADTAGRLHTKSNLMDELSKVRRVIDKRIPGAKVETFFVLDATTGQNGLAQAKAFHEAVGLTGVVLTKLDSTAKGGIVFAIEHELGVRSGSSGWGSRRTTCCRSTPRPSSPRCSTSRPRRAPRIAHAPDGRQVQANRSHERERGRQERRRPEPDRLADQPAEHGPEELRHHHHDPDRGVDAPELAVRDPRLAHGHLGHVEHGHGRVADQLLPDEAGDRDPDRTGRRERDEQVAEGREQQRHDHEPAEPQAIGRAAGHERPEQRPEPAERRDDPDDGGVEPELAVREQQPRRPEDAPHR